MRFFRFTPKKSVGVCLHNGYSVALKSHYSGTTFTIDDYIKIIHPDSFDSPTQQLSAFLDEAPRSFFQNAHLHFCLPDIHLKTQTIHLPDLDPIDHHHALRHQIDAIDRYIWDPRISEKNKSGHPYYQVFKISQKDFEKYVSIFDQHGLYLHSIHPSSQCIATLINSYFICDFPSEPTIVLDLNQNYITCMIFKDNRLQLYRHSRLNLTDFLSTLLKIPSPPYPDPFNDVLQEIKDQLSATISFYQHTLSETPVTQVCLFGQSEHLNNVLSEYAKTLNCTLFIPRFQQSLLQLSNDASPLFVDKTPLPSSLHWVWPALGISISNFLIRKRRLLSKAYQFRWLHRRLLYSLRYVIPIIFIVTTLAYMNYHNAFQSINTHIQKIQPQFHTQKKQLLFLKKDQKKLHQHLAIIKQLQLTSFPQYPFYRFFHYLSKKTFQHLVLTDIQINNQSLIIKGHVVTLHASESVTSFIAYLRSEPYLSNLDYKLTQYTTQPLSLFSITATFTSQNP